jgi:hypothetical protein
MNILSEQQIETCLRLSPRPRPPQDLKEKLMTAAQSSRKVSPSTSSVMAGVRDGWLRRWWPALVPAGFCLVCAVVLAVQRMEISDLKQSVQTLSASLPASPASGTQANNDRSVNAPDDAATIARLKEQVGQLTAEIAQLEQLRAENQNLQAQLAAPAAVLSSEQMDTVQKALDRAERIACVNNLKQVGLALRIWAGDNMDVAPPDFLSMSNELSTPKILVCPGDHGREVAKDFSSFTLANSSYEYFVAGSTNWVTDPERVAVRCPIHGTVGLCDGSVQQVNTNRADLFYQLDGNLHFRTQATPR